MAPAIRTACIGEDIPIVARVVAVADVFDALVSERPYKHAWTIEDAVTYLQTQRGKHFDPVCVDAFVSRLDVVADIQANFSDG